MRPLFVSATKMFPLPSTAHSVGVIEFSFAASLAAFKHVSNTFRECS